LGKKIASKMATEYIVFLGARVSRVWGLVVRASGRIKDDNYRRRRCFFLIGGFLFMDKEAMVEQDRVTVTMTREQYIDLTESLEALACHLGDLTKMEAGVNFFRDQKCLDMPLGEVMRELQEASIAQKPWYNQAMYKQRELAGLIARVRNLCGAEAVIDAKVKNRKDEIVLPNCAA
jgi:hypothetical protein